MIDLKKDILSITDFKHNTKNVVDRVKSEKKAAVLTQNGQASVVVLDVGTYQILLKDAEIGAMMRGIEKGLDSMEKGNGSSVQDVFNGFLQRLATHQKETWKQQG